MAAVTGAPARSARAGGALRRCTALPPDRFAAEVWGREASLSRAADLGPGAFADLLTLDDVDRLVSRHGLRTPFLRVARDGSTLAPDAFTRGGGTGATIADQVADDRVARLFAEGSTLVLQGLHRTHGPLLDLAQDLAADLGHPVQVNAYVTPPQSRGFDPHYDTHDVFVLQVAGRKRWVVHRPAAPPPTPRMPWTDHREDVAAAVAGPPALDVVLEPGDALYLPRGFVHAATALGDVSAHITLGVHPWTRRHVAERVLAGLADDEALRASLPVGVDVASPGDVAAEVRLVLDTLISHLEALRRSPDLTRRVADDLGGAAAAAVRAEPAPPLRQQAALAALAGSTSLRWRRGLRAHVRQDGDALEVSTAEATVRVPVAAAPALTRLLAGESVAAHDLGPDLEAAATLLRQALAVPAGS
jgi:bifunctional lysine-specific demethylase and histidyl-hydroxylase NO66